MIKQAAGDINTRAKAFVTRSYTDTFILFIILISLNLLSLALKLEKTYFQAAVIKAHGRKAEN